MRNFKDFFEKFSDLGNVETKFEDNENDKFV